MSEKLKRQHEFVEWLKKEQMYNEYYSASQMEFAFRVWNTRTDSEEVERLRKEYKDCDHENTVLQVENAKLKVELSKAMDLLDTINYFLIGTPTHIARDSMLKRVQSFLSKQEQTDAPL